jgi:hypothetical protein
MNSWCSGLGSVLIPFFNIFYLTCQTTVPCATVAEFCCPLVVTMRPIPKDKLERLLQVTCSMAGEQGQPIHIGDPGQCPPSSVTSTWDIIALSPGTSEVKALVEAQMLQHKSRLGALRFRGTALGRPASLIH